MKVQKYEQIWMCAVSFIIDPFSAGRPERFRTEDRYNGSLVGVEYAELFKSRSPLLVTDPTTFAKTPFG